MKTTLATLMAFACIACAGAQTAAIVAPTPASTTFVPQSAAAVPALPTHPAVTESTVAGGCCRIIAETAVVVEIAEPLDTAKLHPGDFFSLRLAEPVSLEGGSVIPAGTTGVGQVVDAARSRAGGAPAKLVLAARHLDYAGQQLKLHALKISATGRDNSRIAMGLSVGVGVFAMFVHGGEIQIPVGARADAKLAPNDGPAMASAPSTTAVSIAPATLPQPAAIPKQEH